MAFNAEYIYRILDKYSSPLDRITASTKRFQAAARRASTSTRNFSSKLKKAGQSMTDLRTLIGSAAITAGIFRFAKSASTMEDAMADVSRVTGLTGSALAKMQDRLQLLGRQTGRGAEGLAAIAYEGGKLGIANDQMLKFVVTVMKTAAAFDMLDAEAGRAIGSIRAKLGLNVKSVDELLQRVNYLADNTTATGSKMIEIIERTSGTFKTLHIPNAVIAGWAAFADQMEVTPQLAASGLNMMMARMMQMPGMLKKMLKDPQNAVINFLKRFEKMPETKRGTAILKTFGFEAGRFVMKVVANTKLLDEAMKKAASSEALGSMDREFANILARSSNRWRRLVQTFRDTAKAIGAVFLKVFNKYFSTLLKISNVILKFVKLHPGIIKIVAAIGGLLVAVSAVVIPVGILFSVLAGGLPILSAILGAIGAITLPIALVIGAVITLVTWFTLVYAKSCAFRQSLVNLADAFSPVLHGVKLAVMWIGDRLGVGFKKSEGYINTWGDVFANVINMIAGLLKGIFQLVGGVGGAMGALSVGDFGGAWSAIKEGIGLSPAKNKAEGRVQNNKMEITGQIGVSASEGSKIEKAEIGLNTGYNLVGM